MLELAAAVLDRYPPDQPFVVATVIETTGSAPRTPGAALAVDAGGTALGSISGGCLESTVYQLCTELLAAGDTARPLVRHFGYADDDGLAVGLTCGGSIRLLIERIDPTLRPEVWTALTRAAAGQTVALARIVDGPDRLLGRGLLLGPDHEIQGNLGDEVLNHQVARSAAALLDTGTTGTTSIDGRDQTRPARLRLFVETTTRRPRMLIFGAVDHAEALTRIGAFLGYHITVCDARGAFATTARFPAAHDVVVDWPHRYLATQSLHTDTVICVLTHDTKFDIPLLQQALRLPVAYIGAMGSHHTHHERTRRLRAAGLTDAELTRLRSPIGLDLGGRTPAETALSIAAEIVAHHHGGTGAPLRDTTTTTIHHDADSRSIPASRPADIP